MYFVVKNEIHAFTPKISVILADLAEAATFTAISHPPPDDLAVSA